MPDATPETNVAVQKAYANIAAIAARAATIKIVDEPSNLEALDLAVINRKALKDATALQKEWVDPLSETIKRIKGVFARVIGPAETADAILSKKISDYRIKVKAAAEAEQARLLADAEKRRGEAEELAAVFGTEAPIILDPIVSAPAKSVVTSAGTAGFRVNWHSEVVDAALVPDQYRVIDEKAIAADVRGGLRFIPGVRIWSTEDLVSR